MRSHLGWKQFHALFKQCTEVQLRSLMRSHPGWKKSNALLKQPKNFQGSPCWASRGSWAGCAATSWLPEGCPASASPPWRKEPNAFNDMRFYRPVGSHPRLIGLLGSPLEPALYRMQFSRNLPFVKCNLPPIPSKQCNKFLKGLNIRISTKRCVLICNLHCRRRRG